MAETPLSPSDKEAPAAPTSRYTTVSTITRVGERRAVIIWTPRFIVIFALVLVFSLSLSSILAETWANTGYPLNRVVLGYSLLALGCWALVAARAHSSWIRGGAVFSTIWALLKVGAAVLGLLGMEDRSPALFHLDAAANSALLGAYVCLSIAYTALSRWDTWFFRLAPLVGAGITAWTYFQGPVHELDWLTLERALASTLLYLSLFTWWLRPSCWKAQAGPTFLLGSIPLIQLILNATQDTATPTMQYFFSLIILLAILFGGIRIWQSERVRSESATS